MNFEFANGDSLGSICCDGENVIRSFSGADLTYPDRIFSIFSKNRLDEIGIIKTEYNNVDKIFTHPLLPITYPYEWAPSLYKRAVLFYLDTLLELDAYGLTLKDAMPENILFQNNAPVFVDFFSIVTLDDLENESWLERHPVDKRYSVLNSMFIPYMLLPLVCYARKEFEAGKALLKTSYCNNTSGKTASLSGLLGERFVEKCKICFWYLFERKTSANSFVLTAINQTINRGSCGWHEHVKELRTLIAALDVGQGDSAYTEYYSEKNENFSFGDSSKWKAKQLSYAKALESCAADTLLELGANTGWFPFLAYYSGYKVITTDIDLGCVEHLYDKCAQRGADIMPLWLGFNELTEEHYTLNSQGETLSEPFHMAATKRLQSDMVSCLGLIHHLTLGLGKSFDEVGEVLAKLSKRHLLLEFVTWDDDQIQKHPDFFSNLGLWDAERYGRESLIRALAPFFILEDELPSTPASTRSLLVFRRRG